jgi:glucose uptake protein GlcU
VPGQRARQLQSLGVASGLAAGAWLGAAEAPTKLVVTGLSPVIVSFAMVVGVFLGRWSLPALVHGTAQVRADLRRMPHLAVWGVLGGALWATANTLTVYAIRDVGLSIAFALWNTNSVIGLLWGVLLFHELRGTSRARQLAVVGGALLMCVAAAVVAGASRTQAPGANAERGVIAALTAGVLWGTMYIPYRKAYLTGMSPLAFLTFFTAGEVATMTVLALHTTSSVGALWHSVVAARGALVWLLVGGFVWVIGDVFQQYAAKYIGISRGIPLSNTNQLWGLAWGALVFGELQGASATTVLRIAGGSAAMVVGAAILAFAVADAREQERWQRAVRRETSRYGVDEDFARARGLGLEGSGAPVRRTWIDAGIVALTTAAFLAAAAVATTPRVAIHSGWAIALATVLAATLAGCGALLWRTTRGW